MSKILAGRYEILEKIGDGGMAVVYRARDKLLNRSVAIKVLRPEYVTDANFVNSFRKESRSAASLTHPNIVSIFDVGKDSNIYYIVMELIEGRPLSDIISEKGPLDYRIVLKISEQIASALSVAHKNNIIHRDVKPHNILITQDGHAKITDFGIARAITDGTTVNDNTVKGTVHYFSPEQGRGMYMDERSDIYSLGIVMYEMLTGQVPFDADNAVAVAVMHMNDRMPSPSRIEPGVPPALEQIIMKATEKHQVNRFKNADEMLEALRNVDRLTGGFSNPVIAGAMRPLASENQNVYASDGGYGSRQGGDGYGNGNGDYAGAGDENYDDEYGRDYTGSYTASAAGEYDDDEYAEDPAERGGYMYDDEYDEDDIDDRRARNTRKPRKRKKTRRKDEHRKYKVIGVLAAIVLAAVVAYFLLFPLIQGIMDKSAGAGKQVEDVVGKSETDAKAALEAQGYKVETGDAVFSDTYNEGLVAEQDPAAGEKLAEGETVTLYLSKGPEGGTTSEEENSDENTDEEVVDVIKVPEVTGKSQSNAAYAISAAGLTVGAITMEDSDKPTDQVIGQDPKGGSEAKKGDKVNLTISQGPRAQEVKVPYLLGMTQNKANTTLKKLNLILRVSGEEYSDDYKKGTVMWQQYKKNEKLSEGQTVDVKISKGPEDKMNTVSVTIDYAKAQADNFVLDVILTLSDGTEKVIVDQESAYKASGSKTVQVTGKGTGSKLIVYFDGVIVKTYTINFNTGEVSG
ncbi:MAG: protein kinase [Clostridiales Family XIII bacterium]|jgi:serine/threonine-protein kinase|nr:protein kinase [Clostridiales Family XIII bacterium]